MIEFSRLWVAEGYHSCRVFQSALWHGCGYWSYDWQLDGGTVSAFSFGQLECGTANEFVLSGQLDCGTA